MAVDTEPVRPTERKPRLLMPDWPSPTFLELRTHEKGKAKIALYRCACGKLFDARIANVNRKNTRSCGCLIARVRPFKDVPVKHGESVKRTPTYRSWRSMRERCLNPNCKEFKGYGARGISVCDEWSEYSCFLRDMGQRPIGKTLDRINNNGNYEKYNCRWADAFQQSRNQRSNHLYEYRGKAMTLGEIIEVSGCVRPRATVETRLRKGIPLESALSDKVGSRWDLIV